MLSYLTGFKLPLAYIFFVHPERIGTQRKWGKSSLLKYGPFPSNLRNPVGPPVECQCQKEMWKFSKAFLCCCSLFLSVRVTNDENILVLFEVRRFCCCFLNSTWRRIDYCFRGRNPPVGHFEDRKLPVTPVLTWNLYTVHVWTGISKSFHIKVNICSQI